MKSTTLTIPGQPFRTIENGKEPDWRTSCKDCMAVLPAQQGVLQPRCAECFQKHRRQLQEARERSSRP